MSALSWQTNTITISSSLCHHNGAQRYNSNHEIGLLLDIPRSLHRHGGRRLSSFTSHSKDHGHPLIYRKSISRASLNTSQCVLEPPVGFQGYQNCPTTMRSGRAVNTRVAVRRFMDPNA